MLTYGCSGDGQQRHPDARLAAEALHRHQPLLAVVGAVDAHVAHALHPAAGVSRRTHAEGGMRMQSTPCGQQRA